MNRNLRFKLPDGYDKEQMEASLSRKFAFIDEEPVDGTWTFYDTFDWRLRDRSLLFWRSGAEVTLSNPANGERYRGVAGTKSPAFAWDFGENPLREQLTSAIKMRALLEYAQVNAESVTYRILNEDEKTVARMDYTETRLSRDPDAPVLGVYITVRPVRGYPKHVRLLSKLLGQPELDVSVEQDAYQQALTATNVPVGAYSSTLGLHLDPKMRADEATKVIFRRLLEIIQANDAGVRADIDTEFLHDYRVAVRKTRSALSQVKKVFPAETTARWKADFRIVGSLTNELRDLDVYLLSEEDYRTLLPARIQGDVGPLFAYLRMQRAKALSKVRAGFASAEYTRILTEWDAFLDEPDVKKPKAANATLPIIDLARRRIYKQYRKVIKDGNKILATTEDEVLHELRIECKKLRYLLEFFTSLFPPDEMKRLIKQLKRLQDNLGEFNDLSVQEEYLLRIAGELPVADMQARRALVATGYLVETLERRRLAVRGAFAETFAIFVSPANQKLFRELLANGGKKTDS